MIYGGGRWGGNKGKLWAENLTVMLNNPMRSIPLFNKVRKIYRKKKIQLNLARTRLVRVLANLIKTYKSYRNRKVTDET